MLRKTKFYIGLMLIIQAFSFLFLFVMLYSRKKSLAGALMILSAAGGVTGAYLVYKQITAKPDDPELAAFEEFCFGPREDVEIITDDDISESEFE